MSETVIRIENVSKQYRLGVVGTGSIAHDLNRWWYKIRGKQDPYLKIGEENDRSKKGLSEYVWALNDASFEIKQGDVVGIIGKNGAGKSTLLKILSRTTLPTTGCLKIKGRIASLLEVGTGFHPELTGRENIYLNAAILGMTKREIKSKFDEIVDFSGIERYIDTPVKRYSSGMYVRLAFAVAAHLEPEILIVDEVLAVGDAEFQMKCLGKMKDVSGKGRTVIFVSHNMGAISQLCNRGILLDKGRVNYIGNVEEAVNRYLGSNLAKVFERKGQSADLNYFSEIHLTNNEGHQCSDFAFDEEFVLVTKVILEEWNPNLELSVSVYDHSLRRIFTKNIPLHPYYRNGPMLGLAISFPEKFLLPGRYSWIMCINHPRIKAYDVQDNILSFTIHETGTEFFNRSQGGCVFPPNTKIQLLNSGL